MVEIEVKIRIEDISSMKEKILSLGAVLVKDRHFEENTLYDFPSKKLYSLKHALRLRTAGKKIFLTFKGSPQKSRQFKIRDEYETEVKNLKHTQKILKALDLQPVIHYKKFRTQFRTKKIVICLDETDAGHFIELEGQQSDIVRFANAMGFSRQDFIKKDYIQLIEEKKKSES